VEHLLIKNLKGVFAAQVVNRIINTENDLVNNRNNKYSANNFSGFEGSINVFNTPNEPV